MLEQELLFEALDRDASQMQRFLGMPAGAVPVNEFFSPGSLRKLIGLRGFARIARSKLLTRTAERGSRDRFTHDPQGAASAVAGRPR